MAFQCPACEREIYRRRLAKCEFCDLPLPPEYLLTREEREAMDRELEEMRLRRERDKQKEEEERKRPPSSD